MFNFVQICCVNILNDFEFVLVFHNFTDEQNTKINQNLNEPETKIERESTSKQLN